MHSKGVFSSFYLISAVTLTLLISGCKSNYKSLGLYNDQVNEFLEPLAEHNSKIYVSYHTDSSPEYVPQYVLSIDSITQEAIYGDLVFEAAIFHKPGQSNFKYRKKYLINDEEVLREELPEPREILHLYTKHGDFKEGKCILPIKDVNSLEIHYSKKDLKKRMLNEGEIAAFEFSSSGRGDAEFWTMLILESILIFSR
ncbi:MAG: hypothetical protein N4A46_08920 [Schleiferiaceae bacterium]|jgi:hypothetical protein|nr:hypothetical protein [Schleiferiaceae bacterium]